MLSFTKRERLWSARKEASPFLELETNGHKSLRVRSLDIIGGSAVVVEYVARLERKPAAQVYAQDGLQVEPPEIRIVKRDGKLDKLVEYYSTNELELSFF